MLTYPNTFKAFISYLYFDAAQFNPFACFLLIASRKQSLKMRLILCIYLLMFWEISKCKAAILSFMKSFHISKKSFFFFIKCFLYTIHFTRKKERDASKRHSSLKICMHQSTKRPVLIFPCPNVRVISF